MAPDASGASQQTQIGKSIEIMLRWQQVGLVPAELFLELCTVCIFLPLNCPDEEAIIRMQGDKIDASPMIRAQNEPMIL